MKWIAAIVLMGIAGGCAGLPGFTNPGGKPTKIEVSHVKLDPDIVLEDGTILRGGSETLTVKGSAGAGVDLAKSISFVKDVNTKTGETHVEFAGDTTLKSADQATMMTAQSRLQAELLGAVIPLIFTTIADAAQQFMTARGGSGASDDSDNPDPIGVGLEEILSMLPPGVSLRQVIELLERPGSRVLIEDLLDR